MSYFIPCLLKSIFSSSWTGRIKRPNGPSFARTCVKENSLPQCLSYSHSPSAPTQWTSPLCAWMILKSSKHTHTRNKKAFAALVFFVTLFYDLNSCDEPWGKWLETDEWCFVHPWFVFRSLIFILFCCLSVLRYAECWLTSPSVPWLERLGNQMLIYFCLVSSSDSNAGHWDCNHTVYLFSYVLFLTRIFL